MNEFIEKMLQLGADLETTSGALQVSMIINDAEILYRDEIKALIIPVVSQQRELLLDFSKYVNGRIWSDNEPFREDEVDEWIANNCVVRTLCDCKEHSIKTNYGFEVCTKCGNEFND